MNIKSILNNIRSSSGVAEDHWMLGANVAPHYEPDTAFGEAARIVDRVYGDATRDARRWMISSGFLAIVSVGLGFGWWHQANLSNVERIIVEVDRNGEPGLVYVHNEQYNPTDGEKIAVVQKFIKSAFSLSQHNEINAEWRNNVVYGIWGNGTNRLNAIYDKMKETASERRVRIISIRQTPSAMVWRADWQEQDIANGKEMPWRSMSGDFTLSTGFIRVSRDGSREFIENPKKATQADIFNSPIPLVITDMAIGQEMYQK